MRRMIRNILTAVTLAAVLVAGAWAVSLEEAARQVAEDHEAQVVSAHTVERDGRRIHVIRILTRDGVVRTIRVPAEGD